jgi:hypothetical protein
VTRSWSPTVGPVRTRACTRRPRLRCVTVTSRSSRRRRPLTMEPHAGEPAHQPLAPPAAMAAPHGARRAQARRARPDHAGRARLSRGDGLLRRLTSGLGDAADVRAEAPDEFADCDSAQKRATLSVMRPTQGATIKRVTTTSRDDGSGPGPSLPPCGSASSRRWSAGCLTNDRSRVVIGMTAPPGKWCRSSALRSLVKMSAAQAVWSCAASRLILLSV